jgi:hypothetical protein
MSGALDRFSWAMENLNPGWGEEAKSYGEWLFQLVNDIRIERLDDAPPEVE